MLSKFYIAQIYNNVVSGCIVDLENLPPGTDSNLVVHPWPQGTDLVKWAVEDPRRTNRLITNILNKKFDKEALEFISTVSSFWENLPPATEEKVMLLALGGNGKGDLLRTSNEVALQTYRKMLGINEQM